VQCFADYRGCAQTGRIFSEIKHCEAGRPRLGKGRRREQQANRRE
jgi:hypothetical protein